ncbi:SIR2 family protein [Pseudoflavonifractor phocaeensis]|uniref:SIR2 family protein n=1 Tax=Pseudoflavonifractor phocaeensis TaxID=1870988 RepID=UPI00195970D3|nr:SIR2 family protein [Pseudoflavonifractor phocaeensis]MBM6885836.1 SIR2 family protein [Pseudoflavonifractor phocaeensis]
MNLTDAMNYALSGEAILFAGSGFSYGAKNINKESFRVGDGLRDAIAEDCGIGKTTQSLSVTAQYYIKKKSPQDLINLLKAEFSVYSIETWHNKLLSLPWKRIYTTNYDSVVEVAAKNNTKPITPIVLSDKLSEQDISNICVHLNGYIDNLNLETLNNEFKLTDTSYSCDLLEGNEWFELFKEDLLSSSAIIIIGYSMQFDLDIKRLLSSPAIKKKVLFVDRANPDPISQSLLEEYGDCEFIGVDGFADKVNEAQKNFIPSFERKRFQSFEHEYHKTKVPIELSFTELNNFYTNGEFADGLLSDKHDQYQYIINRDLVDKILRIYRQEKIILILSDLGNGKSVFCKILRDHLRQEDVNVFTFANEFEGINYEIDKICSDKTKHTFVIFDNYKSKLRILSKFRYRDTSKITFVLSARKAINPTNTPIISALNVQENDIRVFYLDLLSSREVSSLVYVIQKNALYSSNMQDRSSESIKYYIQNECHSRFSDILLQAYNSSDIKSRITKLWDESKGAVAIRHLAIIALMKAVMGMELNIAQMLDLLGIDFVLISGKNNPLINEIFNFDGDDVKIKSSIIARELLKTVVGIENLMDTMKAIIHKANIEYECNHSYEELLKNLISHSHFRIFNITSQNQESIVKFYNDIRNYTFCQSNLFFWEQFASACIDCQDYSTAKRCLQNAYTMAKEKEKIGFEPFHVTNIEARCIIEELLFNANTGSKVTSCEAIEALVKCHKLLLKYYHNPENNVSYTFRVGYKYVEVFNLWKDELNRREKSIFIEKKTEMVRLMKAKQNDSAFTGHPLVHWIEELEACK